jgi:alkanesulfonate monooxygenase SsuD/methylene tetrahydromethanopterin reductase-like flavin-dependent oxidoreductase (luciferase family)
VAARRAGRIGDGFFPFGVARDELVRLVTTMRQAAEDAGRDPLSIELTVSSFTLDDDRAAAEARELQELGVTRIVIPAALFRPDLDGSLQQFGERVIGGV